MNKVLKEWKKVSRLNSVFHKKSTSETQVFYESLLCTVAVLLLPFKKHNIFYCVAFAAFQRDYNIAPQLINEYRGTKKKSFCLDEKNESTLQKHWLNRVFFALSSCAHNNNKPYYYNFVDERYILHTTPHAFLIVNTVNSGIIWSIRIKGRKLKGRLLRAKRNERSNNNFIKKIYYSFKKLSIISHF